MCNSYVGLMTSLYSRIEILSCMHTVKDFMLTSLSIYSQDISSSLNLKQPSNAEVSVWCDGRQMTVILLSGWYRGYLARNKAQQVRTHSYMTTQHHMDFTGKVIKHDVQANYMLFDLGIIFSSFVFRKGLSCYLSYLLFISPTHIPFQGVFPASFVHLKEVIIEKRG